MAGLRERQKESRQQNIIAAAKELFAKRGYDKTTIEGIAELAGVSGVTVHNYYGTKSGILLALVVESDRQLVTRLEATLNGSSGNLVELTDAFAEIIRDHAMENLEKPIWRQVIAAVTTNAGSQFSEAYFQLDRQLAQVLIQRIELLQQAGQLSPDISATNLGRALFQLQNARFIQFISSDQITSKQIGQKLRNDLVALFAVCPQ